MEDCSRASNRTSQEAPRKVPQVVLPAHAFGHFFGSGRPRMVDPVQSKYLLTDPPSHSPYTLVPLKAVFSSVRS